MPTPAKRIADKIIETALKELDAYLEKTNWYGRENEVVNLFAHATRQNMWQYPRSQSKFP